MKQRINRITFILITLAPAFIILGAYTYFPAIHSFDLSLYKTKLFSIVEFNGIEHYKSVLTNPLFWTSVNNTVIYTFWSIIGTIALGLMLALLITTKTRGAGAYRTIFFAPYIIPAAAHTLLWYWLLDPRYGLVNFILEGFGNSAIPWLTSREWVLPAFILIDVWKRAGYTMVLFASGIATIPEELYDAGRVDGANAVKRFWHITLPMLTPITLFAVIMAFLHTFQLFTEPFVMTKGGPGNSSTSIVYLIYQEGFRSMNIGRASSMAVVLFIMIFIFTAIVVRKFDVKEL